MQHCDRCFQGFALQITNFCRMLIDSNLQQKLQKWYIMLIV